MKYVVLLGLLIFSLSFSVPSLFAGFGGRVDEALDKLDGPVVVELFTSQSCSSCPPADRLLERISAHKNVIALGFHVTYWDHLHWKDTLSQEFATQRQRAYAAFRRSSRVYTPQMLVNGEAEFVGSNTHKLNNALVGAKAVERLGLSVDQGVLRVPGISDGGGRTSLKFWLFGVKDRYVQDIPSGENRGQRVTYSDAVLYEQDLGNGAGDGAVFDVPAPDWEGIDRLVVLAQEDAYGRVVAAGQVRF